MKPIYMNYFIATFCVSSCILLAEGLPKPALVELQEALKAKENTRIPSVPEVAIQFQQEVKKETFNPAPDLVYKISASKDVLSHLTTELLRSEWPVDGPEAGAVMASVRLFLEKIEPLILEGYERLPVTSNVMPPPGIPNAAAGMNPEAIQDPKLKAEYLELIRENRANGLKNDQQFDLESARGTSVTLIFAIAKWAERRGAAGELILDKLAPEGKARTLLKAKLAPHVSAPPK